MAFQTVLVVVLVALALAPVVAVAQERGVEVSGRIVFGGEGSADLGGLTVALQALLPDGDEATRFETTTTSDGSFAFANVVPEEGHLYRTVVEYAGVRYYGDGYTAEELPTASLELTVYEATEEDSAVRVARQTTVVLAVDREAGVLRILENTTLENIGDKTFIGQRNEDGQVVTVMVPLPPLAFDVTPGFGFSQQGFLVTQGAIADVAPLPPGRKEMIYSYSVAYASSEHPLTRAYPYPTASAQVLVPTGMLGVSSDTMTRTEQVEIGSQTYGVYAVEGISPGEQVGVVVSGLPTSRGIRSRDLATTLRWVGLGSVAVTVAGALGFFWWRRQHRRREPPVSLASQRALLVQRLADLEREHRAGRLAGEEYERRRREERQSLRDLLAREDG